MYKIKIEFPCNLSEINHILRPEEIELIITNDKFLNASGNLSEIIISFIFEALVNGIFEKVGENIFDYIKKIISENYNLTNKSEIIIQIESQDIKLNFSGNNLNSKNTKFALKEISNYLDNINKQSDFKQLTSNSLVFDENSNKWKLEDKINSKWINDLKNEAMEKFNEK